MDGPDQRASLPQLAEAQLQDIAQLCGPSARPCLRATCRALRSAIMPPRMQLLLGPNPSGSWTEEYMQKRHAELLERFQQDWSLSESLAAEWQHVTTGQVVIGGHADNRPLLDTQYYANQLNLASCALAHWRQLQEVCVPFSRALVNTLVACCPQLRALELSDACFHHRGGVEGSDWDPIHLMQFYNREVWSSLQLVQGCRTLRQLHLHMEQLKDVVDEEWRVLAELTQLQALELSWEEDGDYRRDAVCSHVGALTQLTRLVLSNGAFLGEPVQLGPFPHLQHLAVDVCDVDDVTGLASIVGCPQLTYLRVGGSPDYFFSVSELEPLQRLQVLDIPAHEFGADETAWALASCPDLRTLRAGRLHLPLEWSGAAFQHLQQLDLTYITLPGPLLPSPAGAEVAVGLLARVMPGLTSLCVERGAADYSPGQHSPHFLRGHTGLRHLGLPNLRFQGETVGGLREDCVLDVAWLPAIRGLTSLSLSFAGLHHHERPCPPERLRAILQPDVWQHIRVLAVHRMRTVAEQRHVSTLLHDAPALCTLRFATCGATQLLDSVPHLRSSSALRTITLSDCGRGMLLAAGSPTPPLPGAATPPFLQAFLCALSTPPHSKLASVRLELPALRDVDVQQRQAPLTQPHDPEPRAQRAAALRRIRGHIEAAARLVPGGQLPFAVHIEEVEIAPVWPE